jgi:hypothetical protein
MLSSSRSSSGLLRQSSSTSYRRPTGRSLIGPRGPRSESFRCGLRLLFGGASGPKFRFRPDGAPESTGRLNPPGPAGRGPLNPPGPPGRGAPDRLFGDRSIRVIHERKSARSPGFTIGGQDDLRGFADAGQMLAKVRLCRRVRQIPDEQTNWHSPLLVAPAALRRGPLPAKPADKSQQNSTDGCKYHRPAAFAAPRG